MFGCWLCQVYIIKLSLKIDICMVIQSYFFENSSKCCPYKPVCWQRLQQAPSEWTASINISPSMVWTGLLIPCRFPCVDRLFPGFTPIIPTQPAALLYDAVAGYQERDGVSAYRQPHRSRRTWTANRGCHLGIAGYFCRRYL